MSHPHQYGPPIHYVPVKTGPSAGTVVVIVLGALAAIPISILIIVLVFMRAIL